MKRNLLEYNKSDCTSCDNKLTNSYYEPCKSCQYIPTSSGATIGSSHSRRDVTSIVLKKDFDILLQRVEQLEYERLMSCLCRNKIIDVKIDK